MKRAAALALAAAALCACAGPRPGARPAAPQPKSPAVVFQKQTFKLLKTFDPDMEASLDGILSGGYDAAVKNHAGDKPMDIGFTYSMTPKGAVYPLSEIEVSCIMQERYAHKLGPELCSDLFREIGARAKKAVAGRQ